MAHQQPGICSLWYSSYWGLVPVLLLGAMVVVELGVRPMRPSMAGLMLLALKVSGWMGERIDIFWVRACTGFPGFLRGTLAIG